jgi:hypothetical protein
MPFYLSREYMLTATFIMTFSGESIMLIAYHDMEVQIIVDLVTAIQNLETLSDILCGKYLLRYI